MSLLTYNRLMQLIALEVIEGADESCVNAASIDIRLGKKILIEQNPWIASGYDCEYISLRDKDQLLMRSFEFGKDGDVFILAPGQFILAQSQEIFNLPNHIAAEYKLKSSMARIGMDHLNAGWCDPGWHGSVLTLEFRNLTTYNFIQLREGDKIGQVVFFEGEPVPEHASYATKGGYNNNKEVTTPAGHASKTPEE